MEHLRRIEITGTAVPIPGNDIDTDRIVPARFLKEITFDKMGDYLFHDARFNEDHSQKKHPLNDARFKSATIMVVGNNFGCGSSREHAPQAIMRYGIKAIVGQSFAEIFSGNCKSLGIPTVTLNEAELDSLFKTIEANPNTRFTLDLDSKSLWYNDTSVPVYLADDKRSSFVMGSWNSAALLAQNMDAVRELAAKLPY